MSKLPNEINIFTDASVTPSQIGAAWTCPENPPLSGQISLKLNEGTALEGELHAINNAISHICYELDSHPPSNVRILTDSFTAIQELRKPLSLNRIVNSVLLHKELLKSHKVNIRIDWTPSHEEVSPGNQAAHEAAQECLSTIPPLVHVSIASPALLIHRLKKLKKHHFELVTPPGYLANMPSCTRPEEVFINKLCANAAC